jgi:hypothetical protein
MCAHPPLTTRMVNEFSIRLGEINRIPPSEMVEGWTDAKLSIEVWNMDDGEGKELLLILKFVPMFHILF